MQKSNRYTGLVEQTINYKFYLSLKPQHYNAISEITFTLSDNTSSLYSDFIGTQVRKLVINGNVLSISYNHCEIQLSSKELKVGENIVIVQYMNKYNTEGYGLTYLIDVDKKQYVYTHFEPVGCRNVFPCFDFPSFKAPMQLTLLIPNNWIAKSNEKVKFTSQFNKQQYLQNSSASNECKDYLQNIIQDYFGNMWFFEKTKSITTYGFSFIAGEYFEIVSPNPYKSIPISVLGMQTFKNRVNKYIDLIFEVTNLSLEFFQQKFGIPYSFSKCDHAFVYQFQTGAMQNPGMIIYSYNYFSDSQLSPHDIMVLCSVIAHQLSHQWFGNLVGIDSWSEIWLNEGFATFIAYYSMNKIKDKLNLGFQAQFMYLLLQKKTFSCRLDRSDYTHPLKTSHFENPLDIFDKITYGKGGYLVKGLLAAMGEQNFWKAVGKYLQLYSWKSTNINQFFQVLERQNEIETLDIQKWKQTWINKQSYNILLCQEQNNQLKIQQKDINEKQCINRHYQMKTALFSLNSSYQLVDTTISSQTHSILYPNQISAILIDSNDDNFIQTKLDSKSRQFFRTNLINIPNSYIQALIWKCFYEQVVDGKLNVFDYLNILLDHIPTKNPALLQFVLSDLSWVVNTFTPSKFCYKAKKGIFSLLQQIAKQQTNYFNKLILKKFLMTYIVSDSLPTIKNWFYQSEQSLKQYKLNISQRWRMLRILIVNRLIQKEEFYYQIQKLKSEQPSYKYRLLEKTMKGRYLSNQQTQLIHSSIVRPTNINHDMKQAIINSYTMSPFYKSKKPYDILKQTLNKLSQRSWILLFENIFSPSSKTEEALYECNQMLQLLTGKQYLSNIVYDHIIRINNKVKAHSQYDNYQSIN